LGHTTPDGRVIGIFGYSPNYLALFLAPIAVLTIGYSFQFLATRRYYHLASLWSLAAINLLAIYFSGSRGGFLAIVGGLGIFLIVYFWPWIRKRISAKIMLIILILAGLYTSWTLFRPDLSVSPEAGRVASSNNVRWQIWQASLELGFEHPWLGVGLGNFQEAFGNLTQNRANFPEYITPYALTPHNLFLMFWLSTGILGLLAFMWLLVNFYRQAKGKLARNAPTIIVAVFSAIIIYGLIEASIWKNDLSIIFWTFWGLIWII
jgi:putative inorganic carbon (HCO3(-)) transporter